MIKPIGPLCNLDCEYCFYLDKTKMFPGSKFRMSDDILASHIKGYIENQPLQCNEVNFAWQGGEPTLLGLDFFRRVIELQHKYERPGMRIENSLQTNGTKLDSAWCRFLKANNFLVGISLDGPRDLHNRYRKTKGGKGSFDQVKRGLDSLLEEGTEFNVLTAVQRHNGDHPLEVYNGLKELGAKHLQFIPIVERVSTSGVSACSVLPDQFGKFLIEIFEEWRRGDIGRIFVQHFDTALSTTMGYLDTLCVHARQCGRNVALENNGAEEPGAPLPEVQSILFVQRRLPGRPVYASARKPAQSQLSLRRLQGLFYPYRTLCPGDEIGTATQDASEPVLSFSA